MSAHVYGPAACWIDRFLCHCWVQLWTLKRSTDSSAPWPKSFGPPANPVGEPIRRREGYQPGSRGRQPAVEQREHRHPTVQLPRRDHFRSSAIIDDRRRVLCWNTDLADVSDL